MQWELQSTFAILSTSSFLDDDDCYCYDAYELIYYLIDSWDQHRECTTLFYLVKYTSPNFILDMLMLVKQGILIDLEMQS